MSAIGCIVFFCGWNITTIVFISKRINNYQLISCIIVEFWSQQLWFNVGMWFLFYNNIEKYDD